MLICLLGVVSASVKNTEIYRSATKLQKSSWYHAVCLLTYVELKVTVFAPSFLHQEREEMYNGVIILSSYNLEVLESS
jgi:predicted RNA methylase